MATILTGLAVIGAAGFVIYRRFRKGKAATGSGCCGGCDGCPGCGH